MKDKLISGFYECIRPFVISAVSFSFRHVYTKGYQEVKHLKPVIFAANHQITFMDGMVIVRAATNTQPHVLVRSDIFKSAVAKFLLTLIRLLPLYRKRDNMGSINQNEQIFELCHQILARKGSVILFPEGSHLLARQLRIPQKGISRIAFGAEEKHNQSLDLHIVPVGINYAHYTQQWTDLHLYFGQPIRINDYMAAYNENPNKAMNALREDLQKAIEQEMIHIEEVENPLFEHLRSILHDEVLTLFGNQHELHRIAAEKRMIAAVEKATAKQKSTIEQYANDILDRSNELGLSAPYSLKNRSIIRIVPLALLSLLLFPISGLGKLFNFLPKWIISNKILPMFKDSAWWRSMEVGGGLILFPIFYLIYACIGSVLGGDWLIGGMLFFSFPILSIISFEHDFLNKKINNQWKLRSFSKKSPESYQELMEWKDKLIALITSV